MPQAAITTAKTAEGRDLPVIDVTNPAFALPDDSAAIAALFEAFVRTMRRQGRLPRFVSRLMFKLAARRSYLIRALLNRQADFLDGLSTYVMKLGPANLVAPFDSDVDRRVAAVPPLTSMRLRLQQTAKLLAQGLQPELAAAPDAPLALFNIGGGPAIDSLNALILLRQAEPALLDRSIALTVMDIDTAGPHFGANALAALQGEGRPLAGLEVIFRHESYDWNQPDLLAQRLREAAARGAVIAASSEGALFEYGSDEAIVANLQALAGAGARAVAGSVTRSDSLRQRIIAQGRFKLIPRGIEGFSPLAARGGFEIARVEMTPISDQVLLRPRAV